MPQDLIDKLSRDKALYRSPSCPDRHNYCATYEDSPGNGKCEYLDAPPEKRESIRQKCLGRKKGLNDGTAMQLDHATSDKGDLMDKLERELSKGARTDGKIKMLVPASPYKV